MTKNNNNDMTSDLSGFTDSGPPAPQSSGSTEIREQTVQIHDTPPVHQTDKEECEQSATTLHKLVYNDPDRTLGQQMGKDTPITRLPWNTTEIAGQLIATLSFPQIMLQINPQKNLFTNWTFFNTDLEISIQVNGTPFYQGKLLVAWSPVTRIPVNLQRMTTLQHIEIDAAQNINQVLNISYSHIYPMLSTLNSDGPYVNTLGFLYIMVMNPLATNSTDTTLDINVFARTVNANLRNPTFTHTYPLPENMTYTQYGDIDYGNIIEEGIKLLPEVLPLLANLDHPCTTKYVRVKEEAGSDTTHGNGGTTSTRLNLNQKFRDRMPTAFADSKIDEMNVSNIKKRMGFWRTFNWSQTDVRGKQIFSTFVHPSAFKTDIWPQGQASNLAYISNMYELWRGGIDMQIDVICTSFHRGRLIGVFVPDYVGALTFETAIANPLFNINLEQSRSYKINIPYASHQLYKKVQQLDDPTGTTILQCTGTFYLYVQNELRSTDSVPNNVDINVYVAGADDYELKYPRKVTGFNPVETLPELTMIDFYGNHKRLKYKQYGDHPCDCTCIYCKGASNNETGTGQEGSSNATQRDAVQINKPVLSGQLAENHHNWRTLLRRPGVRTLNRYPLGNAVPDIQYESWNQIGRITGSLLTPNFSLLSYISRSFMFRRGPLRYWLAFDAPRNFGAKFNITTEPPNLVEETDNFEVFQMFVPNYDSFSKADNLAINNLIEVTGNYQNQNLKLLNYTYGLVLPGANYTTNSADLVLYMYPNLNTTTFDITMTVYHALADETLFSYYIGPPPTEAPTQRTESHK